MTQNDDNYADPDLRQEIKEDVQAGDKGGKPGQWSARKAQLMAAQYKRAAHERGFSPYTTSKSEQSESQKHLSQWTDEEWQTSDGKAEARETVDGEDGEKVERMRRYLPKRAWEEMSDEEKREAERTKEEGGEDGSQYVPNTNKAKEARKEVGRKVEEGDTSEAEDEEGEEGESTAKPGKRRREDSNEGESDSDTEYEDNDSTEEGDGYYEEEERQPAAKKAKTESGGGRVTRSTRGRDKQHVEHQTHDQDEEQDGDNDQPTSEDDTTEENEHGQPCSASRLPKEGQTVHWRSTSWIEGTVVEIIRSEKQVNGRIAKASEDDPRILLKSSKTGKEAVHKPQAVYF